VLIISPWKDNYFRQKWSLFSFLFAMVSDDWNAASTNFAQIYPINHESLPTNTLVIYVTSTNDTQAEVDYLLKVKNEQNQVYSILSSSSTFTFNVMSTQSVKDHILFAALRQYSTIPRCQTTSGYIAAYLCPLARCHSWRQL